MTPEILKVPPNILGMGKPTNVKFGRPIHRDRLNKRPYFFPKKGRGPGHVTHKILKIPSNVLGTGKATKVKFGRTIQLESLSKSRIIFSKKGCDLVT